MTAEDRPTIADLEIYGLSLLAINKLEEDLGVIYVDQLQEVTESLLRTVPGFGSRRIAELRESLRRFLSGAPVSTPDGCARFGGDLDGSASPRAREACDDIDEIAGGDLI